MPCTDPILRKGEREPAEGAPSLLESLRGDQRGSAYAEGAIVAWFMTIVFGACLWAVQGYATYSATGNELRIATWPEVIEGCSSGDPSSIRSKIPSGYNSVMGSVAPQTTRPRLMDVVEEEDGIRIRTTDAGLARNVGDALQAAYEGQLGYQYTKEGDLLRVTWRR